MMKKLYLFFAVLCAVLGTQIANAATVEIRGIGGDWTAGKNVFTSTSTADEYQFKLSAVTTAFEFKIVVDETWYGWSTSDTYWITSENHSVTLDGGNNLKMNWLNTDLVFTFNTKTKLLTVGKDTGSTDDDTGATSWTVYFDDSVSNWGTVKAYVWDGSNESYKPLGDWSGTAMTKEATSGYYKITFTANEMTTPKVIFNNGGASQTDDLELVNNHVYKSDGSHSEYGSSNVITGVNMPLKPADFANGKKHYFLVGTRTGDWHLQPEWELKADANGDYIIENSLLYTGFYAIAKVDSYANYINHRYTAYACEWAVKSGATGSISLSQQSYTGPSAYGSQASTFHKGNSLAFVYYTEAKKGSSDVNNITILESLPTFVKTIRVELDGDTPSEVSFEGCSLDQNDINQQLVFSLVGDLTTFQNDEFDKNPIDIANKTQRGTNVRDGIDDWQEGWIQYDADGHPYVDGNGNYIYHTRFQRDYLLAHPTSFKYNGVDGEAKFAFKSDNILFVYNEELSNDDSRNTSIGDDRSNEVLYIWGADGQQTRNVSSGSTFSCFVVEDMWVDGQFKVWTGWGGVTKQGDAGIEADAKNQARWYYENGGHAGEGKSWNVNPNTYYGTERDKNKANFSVSKRRFFKRVELWYDPAAGFTNSVIHLIVENGGPNISAMQTGRNDIDYIWNIPDEENQAQNYDVKEIRIYRLVLDGAGNEISRSLAETVGTWAEGEKKASEFKNEITTKDPNLTFGTYQYSIEVDYYTGGTGETEGLSPDGTYFTREAKSNKITLRAPTMPDECKAIQLVYNETTADTEATENASTKYYSFDVRLSANAPNEYIGVKSTTYVDKDVLSCVKYYVVAVPASSTDIYTAIEVENGSTPVSLTKSDLQNTYGFAAEDLALIPDDATLFGVAPMGADYDYRMPNVVFKNVIPASYKFLVGMVSQEDIKTEWALMNISVASTSVSMVVPTTIYEVSQFAISKVADGVTAAITPEGEYAPLGMSDAQPVAYTKFNKLHTSDGKIKQLMVTNGVLTDWAVAYGLDVTVGTTVIPTVTPGYTNASLNQIGGVDANFEYLPVSVRKTQEMSGETGIDKIDEWASRQFDGADFKAAMTVKYTRKEGAVSVDAEKSEVEVNITTGNVENYSKLVAYNDAAMATNGFTIHNQGAWSSQSSTGEAIYYLDAFKVIELNEKDTDPLHKTVGYYSGNGYTPKTTYYKETAAEGYQPIVAVAGGEVYIETNEKSAPFNAFADFGADDNFAEYAAEVGKLPIKIGMVGEGSANLVGVENIAADKSLYELSDIHTLVTAEYPFLVKPAFVEAGISTASEDGYELVTLAYPKLVKAGESDITTDVIDIVADGVADFRIYPNPVVDVVNVAASTELGTIEIYSVDGRLVKVVEVDDTHAAVEVGDLVKGSYIIRAAGATQHMIKK